jgi:hypothetical protein
MPNHNDPVFLLCSHCLDAPWSPAGWAEIWENRRPIWPHDRYRHELAYATSLTRLKDSAAGNCSFCKYLCERILAERDKLTPAGWDPDCAVETTVLNIRLIFYYSEDIVQPRLDQLCVEIRPAGGGERAAIPVIKLALSTDFGK